MDCGKLKLFSPAVPRMNPELRLLHSSGFAGRNVPLLGMGVTPARPWYSHLEVWLVP